MGRCITQMDKEWPLVVAVFFDHTQRMVGKSISRIIAFFKFGNRLVIVTEAANTRPLVGRIGNRRVEEIAATIQYAIIRVKATKERMRSLIVTI